MKCQIVMSLIWSYLFFITIYVKLAVALDQQPSKESNKEAMKKLWQDFYKKTSPKRDQHFSPNFQGDDEKSTAVLKPPPRVFFNSHGFPVGWLDWDNHLGTFSLLHPVDRNEEYHKPVVPLQLGQVYNSEDRLQPTLPSAFPKIGLNNRHEDISFSYGGFGHGGHGGHGGHHGHKQIIHFVPIPVPILHHKHEDKKHEISPWIWPLLIATFLPIILGTILLPLALILLTNLFLLLQTLIGNSINGGTGTLVPVFPGGGGGSSGGTTSGRRKRDLLVPYNSKDSIDRIYKYLVRAVDLFDR